MLCFMFIICVLLQTTSSQVIDKTTHTVFFQIAGLFENSSVSQRLAFKESMRDAKLVMGSQSNNRNEALRDFRLEPVILQLDKTDSYSVWKNLCSNKTMRPIAIFGPQDPISDGTVRDQCSIVNIPHIQATWKPLDTDTEEEEIAEVNEKTTFKKISINFYPRAEEILQAYAELLKYYKWENFAVLYEDDFGLSRIQKILAEFTDHFPVTVRKLDPTQDNVKIFKDLSAFKDSRMIMDCHEDRILKYLEEARTVNMCNEYQHYILTNMDTSKVADKLTPFRSNITWLSMAEYDKLQDSKHFLVSRVGKWTSDIPTSLSPPVTTFKLEALIMNDVANHVLKAVKDLISDDVMRSPYSSLCEADAEPWHFGALLQEKIIHTKSTGVTGPIEFNEKGDRVNYTLYINEIYESELDTIGTWDSSTSGPIVEDRPLPKTTGTQKNSKHFIVISRKTKPYFYEKVKCPEDNKTCVEETADENYEGYSVDLVNRIFSTLRKYNFNYTYSFLDKGYKDYGSYDSKTKKWDGMIGDLLDKKADLAVCDLTITEKRKKVVDFSVPFMSLGISILYTKEKKVPPGMFSFLKPYTFDVWMYTATAYCVVSIVLFVCSRISPADWENPQPCDKDPEELENIWNFKNCTWLTMGSIMTQGCDILPKAIGSRWVCAMWWFFAVIVCQTYIAQLSASMTSALENEPINNVEDLAKQTKVLYGAIKAGSTLDFFKYSKDKMYKQMYENMMANPAVLVKTNDEGEKRVLSGKNKYAFLMESTTIEYKLKRNCELKKVGEELDSKDYGIAMPANSPFRTHINRAILELKELTVIDEIKKKWWEEKNDAKQCDDEKDENDAEGDLEMQNLMGAFIVLIVGLVFSLFITAAEFMNEVRNIVVREKVPHKEVFMKELKASLNFFQMQKPVLRNPSRAPSIASQAENNEKETNRLNAVDNFITFEKGEN